MNSAANKSAPEFGQLVRQRSREYVVADVQASTLAMASHIEESQHRVTVKSVEDVAYHEEMQVIWETEVGARIIRTHPLPSPEHGFDPPIRINAFIDSVRWGAASQADMRMLQAPFRSGIEIWANTAHSTQSAPVQTETSSTAPEPT